MDDRPMVDDDRTSLSRGARVLVVDDDRAVRTVLRINLGKRGMAVDLACNPKEALAALHARHDPSSHSPTSPTTDSLTSWPLHFLEGVLPPKLV